MLRNYMEKLALFGGMANARKVMLDAQVHGANSLSNPLGHALLSLSGQAGKVTKLRQDARSALSAGKLPLAEELGRQHATELSKLRPLADRLAARKMDASAGLSSVLPKGTW